MKQDGPSVSLLAIILALTIFMPMVQFTTSQATAHSLSWHGRKRYLPNQQIAPFPSEQFNVIYADPPWTYNDKAHAGQRGVEYKYSTLTIEDIANLPVQQLAAPNCALFLWATAPLMPEAIYVLNRWGFMYKVIAFTWIKRYATGSLFWGMGNYTRSNPEYVLLGLKGKSPVVSHSVHSVVVAERREHSRKPAEVRDRIERLFGDVPRIELFAREKASGWTVWGDQTDNF